MSEQQDDGRFKKGNQLWRRVDPDKLGRPPRFKKPKELWEEAVQYFQHCEDNPIQTYETTSSHKGVYSKVVEHRVPYTWDGLCVYLNVCNLDHYKTKPEFSEVLTHIDKTIRNQKFSGAASGIFNANIIARDLGLVDKREDNVTILTESERKAKIEELMRKAKGED